MANKDADKKRFLELYNEHILPRPGADSLLTWLEGTSFFDDPASTRYHLSEEGGLVKHSLNVFDRLLFLVQCEKRRPVDSGCAQITWQSIAICGLLHDICKVGCYKLSPRNVKTYDPEKVAAADNWQRKHDKNGDFIWETVMEYKFEDPFPFGHGEKSVRLITNHMKLTDEEAMAIRWHMGFTDMSYQGGDKGVGKVFEMYSLALLTHLADLQASYLDETDRGN